VRRLDVSLVCRRVALLLRMCKEEECICSNQFTRRQLSGSFDLADMSVVDKPYVQVVSIFGF